MSSGRSATISPADRTAAKTRVRPTATMRLRWHKSAVALRGGAYRRSLPGRDWESPEAMQLGSVALEPALGLLGTRAEVVDDAPEAVRVVHLLEMRHLVRGEVIEHEGRGEDQAPGEAQATLGRARAPAALRVAYGEPSGRNAERRGRADDRLGKVAPRFPLEEFLYAARDMGRLSGDRDDRIAPRVARRRSHAADARPVHDPVRNAPEGEHGSVLEDHPFRHARESGGDPAAVSVGEALRRLEIGARRQGQDDLAGGARDPERDPPRGVAAAQRDAEALSVVTDGKMSRIGKGATEQREGHRGDLDASGEACHRAECHLAPERICCLRPRFA